MGYVFPMGTFVLAESLTGIVVQEWGSTHFFFWAALYFGFSLSVHTPPPLCGQTSRSTQHFRAMDLDLNYVAGWWGSVYLDCSMPL